MPDIVLRAENLTKRYGSLTAVKHLTLEAHEGEILGLLGPNGAGKTTTINMLCGLLKPDGGQVSLHGRPLRGGDADVRTRVGVCPQNAILWEKLTCLEQLQFMAEMYGASRREARRRGERMLQELDLAVKRDQLAHTLSGGMRRRLNLALALVHDPQIVILDEPEAGLDSQSRVRVREYIQSLARRKTVILTTHNMDEADRLTDRVAIIDHGELLVVDTPEALKRSVGEGDVIEIGLGPADGDRANLRAHLSSLEANAKVVVTGDALTVRALNAVNLLPAVLGALRAAGVEPGDVRLRPNTLEDVFLQLTGRRLRE